MKQILSLLLLLFFLSSHAQEEVTKLWVESFAGTDAVPEEMRLLPLDVSGRQQMRSQSPQIRALLKLLTEKVLEGEIPAYTKDDLKRTYEDVVRRREVLAQKTQYVSEDPLAPLCNNMRLGQFFEVDSMSGAISKQTVWIELLWDPDPDCPRSQSGWCSPCAGSQDESDRRSLGPEERRACHWGRRSG